MAVSFACKKVEIKDLIKCSFGFSKTEFKVFDFLLGKDAQTFTVVDLSDKVGLDRTSIQRALKKLVEKKLVERRAKNLENGGFLYIYKILHKEDIKDKIKDNLKTWHKIAENFINNW